jgi:hypothetical protein
MPKDLDDAPRVWEIIKTNPADPGAVDGLVWIATATETAKPDEAEQAFNLIVEHHADSKALAAAILPHERSLVKRMGGKPFALVGMNSDKDCVQLKKDMEKERIAWRSFFDGSTRRSMRSSRRWSARRGRQPPKS